MTFDGIDAAAMAEVRVPLLAPSDGLPAIVPPAAGPAASPAASEAPPTLQQALVQMPPCGCGGRASGPAALLIAAEVPPALADLLIEDKEPAYRRGLGGRPAPPMFDIDTALAAAIVAPAGPQPTLTKTVAPQSLSVESGGDATFVDSNGNGVWDPWEEIIVTGSSTPKTVDDDSDWASFWMTGGDFGTGGGTGTGTGGGDGGGDVAAPTPPDMECLTEEEKNQLSEKEREAYEAAEVAAKIFRDIMRKADYNDFEYGALIFGDSNGVITHTPITRGTPTSVIPSLEGLESYGQLIAIVHSYSGYLYWNRFQIVSYSWSRRRLASFRRVCTARLQ